MWLQVDPVAGTGSLGHPLAHPAARAPVDALNVLDQDFPVGDGLADLAIEPAPSWPNFDPRTRTVRSDFQRPYPKLRRPLTRVAVEVEESGVDLGHVEGQDAAVGGLVAPHPRP